MIKQQSTEVSGELGAVHSCSGSNASRPTNSYARPSETSAAATTPTGFSNATAIAHRSKPANTYSPKRPCHDHETAHQGVRRTGSGAQCRSADLHLGHLVSRELAHQPTGPHDDDSVRKEDPSSPEFRTKWAHAGCLSPETPVFMGISASEAEKP